MRRKYLLKSTLKAALLSRFIAKFLDTLIVAALSLPFYPMGLLLSLVYLAISDSMLNGQSVGKRLMGFSVISQEDGSPCSFKQSTIRNLPLLIPLALALIPFWGWLLAFLLGVPLVALEIYLLCKLDSGHRIGDVMADTSVIAGNGKDPVTGRERPLGVTGNE